MVNLLLASVNFEDRFILTLILDGCQWNFSNTVDFVLCNWFALLIFHWYTAKLLHFGDKSIGDKSMFVRSKWTSLLMLM